MDEQQKAAVVEKVAHKLDTQYWREEVGTVRDVLDAADHWRLLELEQAVQRFITAHDNSDIKEAKVAFALMDALLGGGE